MNALRDSTWELRWNNEPLLHGARGYIVHNGKCQMHFYNDNKEVAERVVKVLNAYDIMMRRGLGVKQSDYSDSWYAIDREFKNVEPCENWPDPLDAIIEADKHLTNRMKPDTGRCPSCGSNNFFPRRGIHFEDEMLCRKCWYSSSDQLLDSAQEVTVLQNDEMTEAEREKLDRLYEEFKRGRAEDGGKWPEFTGPGR